MKEHKLGFVCLLTLLAYSLTIVYIHNHSDNVLAWQMITYCSILGPFLGIVAIFWLLQLRAEHNKLKRTYENDCNARTDCFSRDNAGTCQQGTNPAP